VLLLTIPLAVISQLGERRPYTLVLVEIKREAVGSGDAQQQGMMYHAQDLKHHVHPERGSLPGFLYPALLLTVRSLG
jgi:hypothetical protein